MKVLFIASGNKQVGTVSSFVRSQYESLQKEGLDMLLFPVVGHGWRAYARAVYKVRQLIRKEHPDIIHAHYTTCGFVASLATLGMINRPKISVSILGSFPRRSRKWRRVRWAVQHLWDGTLTKSKRTANQLGIDLPVIPNGVNTTVFYPQDKQAARKAAGFNADDKYVIWCSNPARVEKNWPLAQTAFNTLLQMPDLTSGTREHLHLVAVYNKTPQEVAMHMNAADCLLLTSWSEGSPNVVKEAMACNCPVVTTDVGDVNERLEGVTDSYVAQTPHPVTNTATQALYGEENAQAIARCLKAALHIGQAEQDRLTEPTIPGHDKLLADGLTIEQTARKIINWYNQSL